MKSSRFRNHLNDEEIDSVRRAVDSIVEGRKVTAICIYGSRPAGYAKPESDYDVIIVLEKYKPKVRYLYVNRIVDISALVVDQDSLRMDAKTASLGEFVAGRFLNPYMALHGRGFLEEVEIGLKKRVVLESVKELGSIYGEFIREVKIPLEYFLFEKLKKRASVYPPVSYSYARIYGGELKDQNVEASLHGFRKAADELSRERLLFVENGFVRIKAPISWLAGISRISGVVTQTRRGLTQYAVHGYAGRVGLDVIRKEALSKISRGSEAIEQPWELRNPKDLWELDEGLLVMEAGDFVDKIGDHLGLERPRTVTREPMGEIYDTCKLCTIGDAKRKVSIVLKNFSDAKSVKWAFVSVWAIPGRRFTVSPLARLYKEYVALRALRGCGLNTPEVVAVLLNDKTLVTRFIGERTLGDVVSDFLKGRSDDLSVIQEYGRVLASAHEFGYSLGDTKPGNTVLHEGKLYVTDLEQSEPNGDKAWDVAEFLYYATKLVLNVGGSRRLAEAFLEGYLEKGKVEAVRRAISLRYLAPFQPFMLPQVMTAVRNAMREKSRR